MKVNELSKELNVTNKELISFLKDKGYKVSSHMQTLTDEMIDLAKAELIKESEVEIKEEKNVKSMTDKEDLRKKILHETPTKVFKPDDLIPCRSVTPWKLNALSIDKNKVYHWEYYGDVDYIEYRDLQALRRTEYITQPKIIIDDPDLCYQWRRELGDTYKYFLDVEYPEEFFEISDDKFGELLKKAPNVLKEVIKVTAMSMIRNENYPSIYKLNLIDDILGTCLKDFI